MTVQPFWYIGTHTQEQARIKGFSLNDIQAVLTNPERITNVSKYPHQKRYIGRGIAIIVDPIKRKTITVYQDGVITPLRPDQIARGEVIQRTH